MDSIRSSTPNDSQTSQTRVVKCHCEVQAPIWRSSKPKTRGLKFYGCTFYKDKDKYCNFFLWYEKPGPVDTRSEVSSPCEDLEIDRALERKIKALEAALECSRTEITCLKMMLQAKNEAILWNRVIIMLMFIMLSCIIVKIFLV